MVVNDARRRLLHARLVDAMGEEAAEVLMEHLPPAGWADLATKADVQHETALLRAEMATIRAEFRTELATLASVIDRRMIAQTRALMLAMVTTMAASFASSVALVH